MNNHTFLLWSFLPTNLSLSNVSAVPISILRFGLVVCCATLLWLGCEAATFAQGVVVPLAWTFGVVSTLEIVVIVGPTVLHWKSKRWMFWFVYNGYRSWFPLLLLWFLSWSVFICVFVFSSFFPDRTLFPPIVGYFVLVICYFLLIHRVSVWWYSHFPIWVTSMMFEMMYDLQWQQICDFWL